MINTFKDAINIIKIGYNRKFDFVDVINSIYNVKIVSFLYLNGYIKGFTKIGKVVRVYLKYKSNKPVLRKLNSFTDITGNFFKFKDFRSKLPYFNVGVTYCCSVSRTPFLVNDLEVFFLRTGGKFVFVVE